MSSDKTFFVPSLHKHPDRIWSIGISILTGLGKLVFSVALIFFKKKTTTTTATNKQKKKQTYKQTAESYKKSLILIKFLETKESVFTHVSSIQQIMGTKEFFYTRKESNSHRICLQHQYGRRFIVFEHQYGRLDLMWIRSIRGIAQLERQKSKNKPQREKANNWGIYHFFILANN